MTITENEASGVTGDDVLLDGERYYRIANSHRMPEFYMSLVGASDHWMFVSSVGALTAGRRDPDNALFPYAADDQISAARSKTGPITLIHSDQSDVNLPWQPFSEYPTADEIRRNLYKTPLGNKLVFEEINETRQLLFRYRWAFSERFGFVRSCHLENIGRAPCVLNVLDGLQNVLPYGFSSEFVMRYSNLGNAYKKSELLTGSGLGLFYLSSIPTDRAEPSEGLKTTTVWHAGLNPQAILLSTQQLHRFRKLGSLRTESDVRGKAGAYLIQQTIELMPGETIRWHVVAELEQDHADVIGLDHWLQGANDVSGALASDIELCQQQFLRIVSSADALQCGANDRRSDRHASSTIFNVMRGGIPLAGYQVDTDDFQQHVAGFNLSTYERHRSLFESLPPTLNSAELRSRLTAASDPDLARLGAEYLPLAFSRRHGDPTRPWNRFAIRLRSESGRTNLNYQGNWRDIFQNWEALAVSFPEFTTAMICRFVNATTADGYNPYRLTRDGFEWEEPAPDDPWANIGYWGDHQIIYLLKLLESNQRSDPESMANLLDARIFVHANVPYRIKGFDEIRNDPQSTIEFDENLSAEIAHRVGTLGADGKLLRNKSEEIQHVTLLEKLLTLSLAKLSNFVPDGGVWLNTQRPEWNDANNALVGNGLSMVTTYYLFRWFRFLREWLLTSVSESFEVSVEVKSFFEAIKHVLVEHLPSAGSAGEIQCEFSQISPIRRSEIAEALGRAGSEYRTRLYDEGVSGRLVSVSRTDCLELFESALRHLEATMANNRRSDGLFQAYNLLDWSDHEVQVEHLYEMLEGQVAVLSSGWLSPSEAVELLDALRQSALYREDQRSYLLYPNRDLPRFLDKNRIPSDVSAQSDLLRRLVDDGDESIVRRDLRGDIHFNGRFRNAADLRAALDRLPQKYRDGVQREKDFLAKAFVDLFRHRQFTGRSGTFFAYEGLGSIYWHMVSKLALAVSENLFWAIDGGAEQGTVDRLREHFSMIREGIGAEKSPSEYGAFPSDPYSHTPENAGVKQPGMTGQVKEDILSRLLEIGVHIEAGCVHFRLDLFDRDELLGVAREFLFFDIRGNGRTIEISAGGFGFTLCQVPVVYHAGERNTIHVCYADGRRLTIDGMRLDPSTTHQLFSRSGIIESIECEFTDLRARA